MHDFVRIFGAIAPKNNYHIEGLRLIRDWMYKNGLTSAQAFEELANKRKRISVEEFDIELKKIFNMTSPEIESIFVSIDENLDGYIDRREWTDKVYEDSDNPLQLFREIVNTNNLSSDDILFKMNLRIWDDALDFNQFSKALRILDSSLTNDQIKAMAKSMKNADNKVEVTTLIRNLCGKDYETVDFRDKVFKRVYHDIFESSDSDRKDKFRNLLVKHDDLNDGSIVGQDLQKVLAQVCNNISQSEIQKFVRFLDKDVRGRIDYTQFTNKLEEVKNYNPFKNLVNRIKSFMKQNNQSVEKFMRHLVLGEMQAVTGYADETKADLEKKVTTNYFAKFLKSKVDKKNDINELTKYSELMDIDADGYISIHDLQSCLGNLNNETFYKDNGATLAGTFKTILTERETFFPKQVLQNDKALQVISKIKEALLAKGISFRELFAKLDTNDDEFMTFTEFSENLDPVVKLSPYIKEQLFALMDVNKIGMVDYDSFLSTMKRSAVTPNIVRVEDNFNWEYEMVDKIKEWIRVEGITVEEAFKAFDRDFDGKINIEDLKYILINIIKVGDKSSIVPSQLERLFKLLASKV
jgi:Ca2+-binding EF-hand superfamily protein